MAYSVVADVQAEFKNLTFSSSTYPTDTSVTAFIAQADAFIDSKLGMKYVVPITAAQALLIVKTISVWLVAARVKEIIRVKLGATAVEQETREGDLRQMALDMLKEYIGPEFTSILPGADLASASDGVRSYVVDNSISNQVDTQKAQW